MYQHEILRETDINVVAITNHNHFDLKQYQVSRDGVVTHPSI